MSDTATPRSSWSRSAEISARVKLLIAFAVGVVGTAVALVVGVGQAAPLIGWDLMALTFCVLMWTGIWSLDSTSTAAHVTRENPGRDLTDVVLVIAAAASIAAVGVVLFSGGQSDGAAKFLIAGLALISIFVSWTLIHTVFTTKYAGLYYGGEVGGIDFNEKERPDYRDFAYLAFTLGMTFQVSDTDLQTKEIRRTALRHAWLSFPFGAVIIAAAINLVSGLAK